MLAGRYSPTLNRYNNAEQQRNNEVNNLMAKLHKIEYPGLDFSLSKQAFDNYASQYNQNQLDRGLGLKHCLRPEHKEVFYQLLRFYKTRLYRNNGIFSN